MSHGRVTKFRSGVLLALGLVACSDSRSGGRGVVETDFAFTPQDGFLGASDAVVYGHSAQFLYTLDPDTLQVKPVGAFQWPAGRTGEEMTDIALDRDGNMTGISYEGVYSIEKSDAKCTFLAPFQGSSFNGLSYIYADVGDGSTEVLVGAGRSGDLYEIDPATGAQTHLGAYGGGRASSGDLVSVMGATYATTTGLLGGEDTLVKVDPMSGVATAVGPTGYSAIWGLGYWKQELFGFTNTSGLVKIDINTGAATPIGMSTVAWYGAGVTTAAPTTVQ